MKRLATSEKADALLNRFGGREHLKKLGAYNFRYTSDSVKFSVPIKDDINCIKIRENIKNFDIWLYDCIIPSEPELIATYDYITFYELTIRLADLLNVTADDLKPDLTELISDYD